MLFSQPSINRLMATMSVAKKMHPDTTVTPGSPIAKAAAITSNDSRATTPKIGLLLFAFIRYCLNHDAKIRINFEMSK